MFNFLKTIFQKEEPIKTEEVKINELLGWLDDKLSQIDLEEQTDFFNKLKDKKRVLEEKINFLEEQSINEKEKNRVEEKVKNIVLGHKDNYVREMKRFLEGLEIPEEIDLWGLIKFNEILNGFLDELAKKTAKGYQAAQHLFFNQVEEVFKAVGEINLLVKNLDKRLEKEGLKRIKEIQERVKLLQEEKKRREKLEDDLKSKEAKLNWCLEGKKKQQEEIVKLKGSREYQEFLFLKKNEEEIKSLIEKNKDEVHLFFSKLGRALRKYEKVTLEKQIVKDYLENAAEAFFNDKELKILGILDGLKKSMEKEEVKLDSKQKENAFGLIKKAKEGYLKEVLEKGEELQKKTEAIKTKFRGYAVDKLIEEVEYKSEHFEGQIVLMKREIEELKVKLRASGGKKLEEDLKELVREVLRIDLVIN